MLDCLKNIIGLTRSDCACFEAGRPEDYNVSLSGYFLADDFNLNLDMTSGSVGCQNGSVWDILEHARELAILNFIDSYEESFMDLQYAYNDFSGEIGSRKYNMSLPTTDNVVGIRIDPKCLLNTRLRIDAIHLNLQGITTPLDVDVQVFSSNDLVNPIKTVTCTLDAANSFVKTTLSEPIVLDLDPKITDTYYYIVYEVPAGATVPNNNIEEGCSCSAASHLQKNGFMHFAYFKGIQADAFANLQTPTNTSFSGYAYGLLLEGSTTCDSIGRLCELAQSITGTGNKVAYGGKNYSLGKNMAAAIGHQAAVLVLDKIILNQNVNRLSLLDKKPLYGARAKNIKHQNESFNFVVENLPYEFRACYKCDNNNSAAVTSLV